MGANNSNPVQIFLIRAPAGERSLHNGEYPDTVTLESPIAVGTVRNVEKHVKI